MGVMADETQKPSRCVSLPLGRGVTLIISRGRRKKKRRSSGPWRRGHSPLNEENGEEESPHASNLAPPLLSLLNFLSSGFSETTSSSIDNRGLVKD